MADELNNLLLSPAEIIAPRMLGSHIVRQIGGQKIIGKIVECESYDQNDAASHSFKGETQRTAVMFGPPGRLYVYFTYGMHYCCNIVCGPTGQGSAVLIRAIEPLKGTAMMAINRNGPTGINLTNGPAKVCQALAINMKFNGHDLSQPPLQLLLQPPRDKSEIVVTTRVGIKRAQQELRRFYISDNPFVSKVI